MTTPTLIAIPISTTNDYSIQTGCRRKLLIQQFEL